MDFLAEYKSKHGKPPNWFPDGVRVVDTETFFIQTDCPEDTLVDKVLLDCNGRTVEVLRYNEDDSTVFVCYGNNIKSLKAQDVLGYIVRNFA